MGVQQTAVMKRSRHEPGLDETGETPEMKSYEP